MSLVEKEITRMNVERARLNPELEKYVETEHKLTPKDPETLAWLKDMAVPVEQHYLSTPHDEFSLRVRATYKPEGVEYTATQKDRGDTEGDALKRGEISTPITPETFALYQSMNLPSVYKLRAEIMEGVVVDFYDDPADPVVIEVEHEDLKERARLLAYAQELTGNTLVDRSHDTSLTNEARAHRLSGAEGIKAPESLDTFSRRVLGEMLTRYAVGKNQVVVGLTGMSGSGKSTVAKAVQEQVAEMFGEAYRPIVISTDDYHVGKEKLEALYGAPYTDWDAARTYNTAELAQDLKQLELGVPLIKRHFDFASEEPVREEELPLSPFVIVEGLYAGSKDLEDVRTLHFEIPTSVATSVGRDLRRLMIDDRVNDAFPDAPSRLRYQLETAIKQYLSLEHPPHMAFSASTRGALAGRAFILEELKKV